ncbi:hypothetical protein MKW98_010017 [Papaver atlanticum]|uniref:Uncharacterized protein n=1 Tax=Papaver atlanticum TaxID=357466 RepID=A0AAD4X4B9_9MAGN|nr:hypothetical protein MKW98_010017 [Papaver atlanticum]
MGYRRLLFDRGKMQVADAETTLFVHLSVLLAQDCHWTIFILIAVNSDAPLYCVLMSIHGDGWDLNGSPSALVTEIYVFTFFTVFKNAVMRYIEFLELLKVTIWVAVKSSIRGQFLGAQQFKQLQKLPVQNRANANCIEANLRETPTSMASVDMLHQCCRQRQPGLLVQHLWLLSIIFLFGYVTWVYNSIATPRSLYSTQITYVIIYKDEDMWIPVHTSASKSDVSSGVFISAYQAVNSDQSGHTCLWKTSLLLDYSLTTGMSGLLLDCKAEIKTSCTPSTFIDGQIISGIDVVVRDLTRHLLALRLLAYCRTTTAATSTLSTRVFG